MRTVDEALEIYSKFNKGSRALRRMVTENLMTGESVFFARSTMCLKPDGKDECLLAATQRRVIACSKKLIAKELVSIPLLEIRGLQIKGSGIVTKELHIQGMTETIIILSTTDDLAKTQKVIQTMIDKYDVYNHITPSSPGQPTIRVSARSTDTTSWVEEMLKWKQLLDAGAITQEEYNAKKREVLGL